MNNTTNSTLSSNNNQSLNGKEMLDGDTTHQCS